MDIFCENKKCPICNSNIEEYGQKLNASSFNIIDCKNGCYDYKKNVFISGNTIEDFLVFNTRIVSTEFSTKQEFYEKVIRVINYWKENDRYLMKILNREE